MIYGFTEVTPKMNKKKVMIASGLAVLIIGVVVFGIYYYFQKESVPIAENTMISSQTESLAQTTNHEIKKSKHVPKIQFFPVYSEQAKARFEHFYQSEEKEVYLTFDDGPSKSVTPLILDLLKQENIKATFFVLGARVDLYPSIVKRAYEEGHYIANHGYSHIYGNIYQNVDAVLVEYNKAQQAIQNAIGNTYNGHLFRFPGGSTGGKYHELKQQAKILLKDNHIASIDWNSLSNDAAGAKTKEALLENVIQTVGQKQTVVILMHDAGDKILTYEVLPEVIRYLRENGYTFKTFYDIMK